jgi:hypothetical protein
MGERRIPTVADDEHELCARENLAKERNHETVSRRFFGEAEIAIQV